MFKSFLNKLFFKRPDKFLIIEVLSHFLRVSHIQAPYNPPAGGYTGQADLNRKKIYLAKTFLLENSLDNLNETFSRLKKLLKKFGKLSNYQIILNLDSSIAATIFSTVSLIRNHSKNPIDEPDLDNLISQAIWKVLDRYRAKAAAKLKVADLDIVLSDVKVKQIKLDGHKVVNPIGFPAKLVEIGIVQTFINRNLGANLKSLLPKEKVVLIGEAGASWAGVLSAGLPGQGGGEPKFLLVNLFPCESSIYFSSPNSLFYLNTFDWGEKNLKISLAHNLAVANGTAKEILNYYISANCSDFFAKKIEKLLVKDIKALAQEIESRAIKTDAKTIYLLPFFALPPTISSENFKKHFRSRLKIIEVTDDLISNKFGFEIEFDGQTKKMDVFPILAGWFQFYFLQRDDKIGKMANRRIKWLN